MMQVDLLTRVCPRCNGWGHGPIGTPWQYQSDCLACRGTGMQGILQKPGYHMIVSVFTIIRYSPLRDAVDHLIKALGHDRRN